MSESFEEVFECYQKGEFPLYDYITPWHDTRGGLKNQFVTADDLPLFTYDLYGWVLLNEPIDRINRFIDHYLGMGYFQPNMVMGICSCLDKTCGGTDVDILPIVTKVDSWDETDRT